MQGIKITGMLVWSVHREGDGPLKAFNSLGPDLAKAVPKTANDNLTSQAAAIVRSVIATSEISDLLTNREKVRTAIKNEMTEQVKGWGVWLETVEITGV
jgi:regulator of protease activity HflC (stomatin/prohibitin superfamily)